VYQRFEHKYNAISAAEAAHLLNKRESDLEAPFWYRFPLGWFMFGPLFLLAAICSRIWNLRKRGIARLDEPPAQTHEMEKRTS
jgi:hypothetical protein